MQTVGIWQEKRWVASATQLFDALAYWSSLGVLPEPESPVEAIEYKIGAITIHPMAPITIP